MSTASQNSIVIWLARRRAEAGVSVSPLAWRDNLEWRFEDGLLRHQTGGFFSVIGVVPEPVEATHSSAGFPIIDQPEVGLLGFLVRDSDRGPQWLLQAKAEPGTVGTVQVGPTVQATESNYRQLHGGTPTRYLSLFLEATAGVLADSHQSEQGTRFLGKYNRNMLRRVDSDATPGAAWRWVDAVALRHALSQDFAVNTDARSVIVCSDWTWLCEDQTPFSPARQNIPAQGLDTDLVRVVRARLFDSYRASDVRAGRVIDDLETRRAYSTTTMRRVPLDSLTGWTVGPDALLGNVPNSFDVGSYDVRSVDRERNHWQQPLVRPHGGETVRLFLSDISSELRAFFGFADEPGFQGAVQLGASWQSDRVNPTWTSNLHEAPGARRCCAWRSLTKADDSCTATQRTRSG